MRFFSSKRTYDFMRLRGFFVVLSILMVCGSIGLLVAGQANLGTDFRGGTEVELAFKGHVAPQEIRRPTFLHRLVKLIRRLFSNKVKR
jgi:preprotein translocase subunit SecF